MSVSKQLRKYVGDKHKLKSIIIKYVILSSRYSFYDQASLHELINDYTTEVAHYIKCYIRGGKRACALSSARALIHITSNYTDRQILSTFSHNDIESIISETTDKITNKIA